MEVHYNIQPSSWYRQLMIVSINDKKTGKQLLQISRDPECMAFCLSDLSSRHYDIEENKQQIGTIQVISLLWVKYVVLYNNDQTVQYVLRIARQNWTGEYSFTLLDKYERTISIRMRRLDSPMQMDYDRSIELQEKKSILVLHVFSWFIMTSPWKH